jgi:hypothetical protein
VLSSLSVKLDRLDGIDGVYSFLETIPQPSGVTAIQIRQVEEVLAQKLASDNPPGVRILSPNEGGELLPGTMMSWSSSDLDGDPLTYDVFYSSDSGETWRLLAMGLTAKRYQLPARLPGGESVRLRVTARDGFWTTSDETDDTFTVAASPPRAIILNSTGTVVRFGSTVHLTGIATDLEQGPITKSERFSWTSDRDGDLGTGQEIATRTLSKGVHLITLKVTDDDHKVGSTTILLYVGVDAAQVAWTSWLNADNPCDGDLERLSFFARKGLSCPQPLAIDCRTTSGKNWTEAGHVYRCDVSRGGFCIDTSEPFGKPCEDYEVRFLCPAVTAAP